jgi:hypothetical protein
MQRNRAAPAGSIMAWKYPRWVGTAVTESPHKTGRTTGWPTPRYGVGPFLPLT